VDAPDEVRHGDGARPVRGVNGDHLRPGRGQRVHVLEKGRDADLRAVEASLDKADHGRGRRGAHRTQVGRALDPQPCCPSRERRQGQGHDDVGPVQRPPRDRLAGHQEAAANSLEEVVHRTSPGLPDMMAEPGRPANWSSSGLMPAYSVRSVTKS
jgi:hypothetical protein